MKAVFKENTRYRALFASLLLSALSVLAAMTVSCGNNSAPVASEEFTAAFLSGILF